MNIKQKFDKISGSGIYKYIDIHAFKTYGCDIAMARLDYRKGIIDSNNNVLVPFIYRDMDQINKDFSTGMYYARCVNEGEDLFIVCINYNIAIKDDGTLHYMTELRKKYVRLSNGYSGFISRFILGIK